MPNLTQVGRNVRITTPLGPDALIPISFTGHESLSQPYLFTVELASENAAIASSSLLGKSVTLHVDLPDGGVRHINGLVRRFTSLGATGYVFRYRAELVPALWFLSLSSDCRTFEQKTPIEVINAVFSDAGVPGPQVRLTTTPDVREYVVQYRETNLAFVSRLLEEVGIYYTFEHSDGQHKLVLTDAKAGSIAAGQVSRLRVDGTRVGDRPRDDTVFEYRREYAVHTGKILTADHDLLRVDSTGTLASGGPHARGERFEFLGDLGLDRSPLEAKIRIEIEERDQSLLQGKSSCMALASGTRVTLIEAPADVADQEFHVIEVTHRLEGGDLYAAGGQSLSYENSFVAIPHAKPYRPAQRTPRPSVRGTQLAKVVGTGGDGKIDVDADGRILLEFPWDRGMGKDGGSNHRVHVASVWGGTKWGFVQIPRVGQEVLVEYLEGDIDRPLVTGRVYNSQHQHPYPLPANRTQSGWKSQTVDGGSENFNEIRFEDLKDSEHVYVQAEKDLEVHVKNDETRDVLHDRTTTIKNHDTRTVSEGNDSHTVSKGDQTVKVDTGKQTITVKADQATTITSGNRTVTVEQGNDTLAVKMGNISIKADMGSISVEAKQKIELKVGSNSITIDMSGVTIKGMNVKAEAKMAAEMKGLMTKLEGSAMMQVKAPMTQVNGDGMLTLKGGITMIN